MTNGTLVAAILESRDNFGYSGAGYDTLTYDEAQSYTLESGATLIAQQCREELHEIFELAVIEQEEATLGAAMEGYNDVMESNTYGPVFEAAEKSVGKKIIAFLTKLKDRVVAFFKNLFTKISAMFHNYDKFLEKKAMDMKRAGTIDGIYLKDWNNARIDSVTDKMKAAADAVAAAADWAAAECNSMLAKVTTTESGEQMNKFNEEFDRGVYDQAQKLYNTLTGVTLQKTDYQATTANADMNALFVGKKKVKVTLSYDFLAPRLKDTKDHAKKIKTAESNFNKAYNDAIKKLKKITDDMEKSNKKGIAPYLNKTTSMLSRMQVYTNAYATAGYRALIGRANEARQMAGVLISGSVPDHLKKAE